MQFREPWRSPASASGHFERPSEPSDLEPPLKGGTRGSSSLFERAIGADRIRTRIGSRCAAFETRQNQPSRTRPWSIQSVRAPLRKVGLLPVCIHVERNLSVYVYICHYTIINPVTHVRAREMGKNGHGHTKKCLAFAVDHLHEIMSAILKNMIFRSLP